MRRVAPTVASAVCGLVVALALVTGAWSGWTQSRTTFVERVSDAWSTPTARTALATGALDDVSTHGGLLWSGLISLNRPGWTRLVASVLAEGSVRREERQELALLYDQAGASSTLVVPRSKVAFIVGRVEVRLGTHVNVPGVTGPPWRWRLPFGSRLLRGATARQLAVGVGALGAMLYALLTLVAVRRGRRWRHTVVAALSATGATGLAALLARLGPSFLASATARAAVSVVSTSVSSILWRDAGLLAAACLVLVGTRRFVRRVR